MIFCVFNLFDVFLVVSMLVGVWILIGGIVGVVVLSFIFIFVFW